MVFSAVAWGPPPDYRGEGGYIEHLFVRVDTQGAMPPFCCEVRAWIYDRANFNRIDTRSAYSTKLPCLNEMPKWSCTSIRDSI